MVSVVCAGICGILALIDMVKGKKTSSFLTFLYAFNWFIYAIKATSEVI